MKVGAFLHVIADDQQSWKKQINLFRTLKGLGSVEIWLEALNVAERNVAELKEITAGFSKVVHAPFMNLSLISCHHEVNQASISVVHKSAQISESMGAALVTVHAGAHPVFYAQDDVVDTLVESWRKLAAGKNFFALENISPQRRTTVSFPTDVASLRIVKESLPDLKVTLDIGHLIQANESTASIESFFKDYSKDIVNIHLHDAVLGGKGHLPLGSGDLSLGWFFGLLKKYNYNGYVHLELLNSDDLISSWSKIVNFV